MKRSFLIASLLLLTIPVSSAELATPVANPLYIGIGTGLDLPGSNWSNNYNLGADTHIFGGYQIDPTWSAQLDLEQVVFTSGYGSVYNFRTLAEAKYTFSGQGFQPYLIAGPGMVFQADQAGNSTSNFDALVGAGLQFNLAVRTHAFVEAKYNFIMSQSTTFTDLPITAGLWVGL